MIDRRIDLAIGFAVIVFAVAILVFTGHIRPTGPVVDPIGPRGFPYLLGGVMLVAGIVNVLGQVRRWKRSGATMVPTDGEPDETDVPASGAQAFALMAVTFAYVAILTRVGYVIATPVYVAAALWLMRLRSTKTIVLTAVGYTLVTFVIFAVAMRVSLPLGPLADLLRSTGYVR
jgi:putative tricarboxylic transport membrane protein